MVDKRLIFAVVALITLALLVQSVFVTANYVVPFSFLLVVGLAWLVWWLIDALELRESDSA